MARWTQIFHFKFSFEVYPTLHHQRVLSIWLFNVVSENRKLKWNMLLGMHLIKSEYWISTVVGASGAAGVLNTDRLTRSQASNYSKVFFVFVTESLESNNVLISFNQCENPHRKLSSCIRSTGRNVTNNPNGCSISFSLFYLLFQPLKMRSCIGDYS
jgi:hypothetical protein